MQQPKNEPNPLLEESLDLFDEPRDHSNQWDISMLWEDTVDQEVDPNAGRGAE